MSRATPWRRGRDLGVVMFLVAIACGCCGDGKGSMILGIAHHSAHEKACVPRRRATRAGVNRSLRKQNATSFGGKGPKKSDRCKHPEGCERRATFGYDSSQRLTCSKHRQELPPSPPVPFSQQLARTIEDGFRSQTLRHYVLTFLLPF